MLRIVGIKRQLAMVRWPILAAITAVAPPLMLGCGADYIDPPAPTPVQLQTPACTGNVAPKPSRIPPDFVPVEALVCGEKFVGSPRETSGSYLYTRYRGNFDGVVDDFARKDRKQNKNCMASVMRLPEVWLINAVGLGLIPRYPMDECGTSNIKALNDILKLPIIDQRTLL